MVRHPEVGDVVVFHDQHGQAHNALVTCYFGCWIQEEDGSSHLSEEIGCANLVFCQQDEKYTDEYGRQLDRVTSIAHRAPHLAHGGYWRWPDEEPIPYRAPSAT